MKSIFLCLIFFISTTFISAQNIDFPDPNFKYLLVNTPCWDPNDDFNYTDVDTNDDGEISIEEAELVQNLRSCISTSTPTITNIEGIEFFVNLEDLDLCYENLGSVDLSQNSNLKNLYFRDCEIASLDLSQLINLEILRLFEVIIPSVNLETNPNLQRISITDNPLLTTIDISNNNALIELAISGTEITEIDLSQNSLLNSLNIESTPITSIDLSQIPNLTILNLNSTPIASLDFSQIPDLTSLKIDDSLITSLDLSLLPDLEVLSAVNCQIDFQDFSQNPNLDFLNLRNNLVIQDIDLSNNLNLEALGIGGTNITEIDLTHNQFLNQFEISNSNIERIFMKNGRQGSLFQSWLYFENCINLEYICANEYDFSVLQQAVNQTGSSNVTINSYCSFVPGGEYYTVEGTSQLDINTDGCDVSNISVPNLNFNITNGSNDGSVISNASGNYFIPLQEGEHTITPILENPTYFNVSPSVINVDFPSDVSPLVQDSCITPNGVFNDLEVIVIPLQGARPGFDVNYQISYKNKGTTTLSGSLSLQFNDDYMTFLSANPVTNNSSTGILEWGFSDLEPFETGDIEFTMSLNTPTDENFPLNSDDVLEFTVNISSSETDETPEDNAFTLNQIVVNSFDPNDKRCLEGETITPDMVGRFVHYMIRFENTGTANAINVVVKDEIDLSKFDISTLVPLTSSHDFVTRIQNTNEVEFIFENIDLPFDDANNDGFVVFKIKTLDSLTLGDTFSNDAEIYFDFNAPIITNDFVTSVEESLSINELELYSKITLFPNPVNNVLYMSSEILIDSASIYDIHGRLLQATIFDNNESQKSINLEHLSLGTYFVTLRSKSGNVTEKIIKN